MDGVGALAQVPSPFPILISVENKAFVLVVTSLHFCSASPPGWSRSSGDRRPPLPAGCARRSPLERSGRGQNVRPHTKFFPASATGWQTRLQTHVAAFPSTWRMPSRGAAGP